MKHLSNRRFPKSMLAIFAACFAYAGHVGASENVQIEVLRSFVQLDPVRINELSDTNQRRAGSRLSSVIVVNGNMIAGGEPPELGEKLSPVRRTIKNAFRMRVDQLTHIPKLQVRLRSRSGAKNQFGAVASRPVEMTLPAIATISAVRYEERMGQRWLTGDVELLIDATAAAGMGAFTGQLSFEVASF